VEYPNETIAHLQEKINTGSALRDFYENHFGIFKDQVLEPMKEEAICQFAIVDPANLAQVISAQTYFNILNDIEKVIKQRIEEGRLATETMKSINRPETDV